jgi:ribosomal protein S14
MESMHKKKIEKDPSMQEMMNYIKRDFSRAISLKDFTQWCHKYPSILTPLRMLQTHLRFQVIGPNFWTKMAEQRRAHPEQGRFDYIPQLQKRVIAETKFFLTRGQGTVEEMKRLRRRGRGPEGDTRDNITRKQSVLVKYFNLSRFSLRQPRGVAPAPGTADTPAGVDAGVYATESAKGKAEPAVPIAPPARRRRSSFLLMRPVLVIKAEMPDAHVHKKSTGKKHKKEVYQESNNKHGANV